MTSRSTSLVLPKSVKESLTVIKAEIDGDQTLSLLARKLFLILLGIAREDYRRNKIHSVRLQDLAGLLLEGHESTDRIKQALDALYATSITANLGEGKENRLVRCHILSYELTRYEEGQLRFNFDPFMLELLEHPEVYGKLNYDVSHQMKTLQAFKLWKLMSAHCRRFDPVWRGSIQELRKYLEVGDKYEDRFDHFRSRILEKSIAEVSNHAEFDIFPEYLKSGPGGKVHEIHLKAVLKRTPAVLGSAGGVDTRKGAGRKKLHDDGMADIFGKSADIDSPPHLPDYVIDQGLKIAGSNETREEIIDRWFKDQKHRAHANPEANFLSWVNIATRGELHVDLAGIDVANLDDMLGG